MNPSDLAKNGETEEDVPHFSSECEPNRKEDYDSISAVPVLGGSNSSDQYLIPSIWSQGELFKFVIFAFIVILIIWYIYRQIFCTTRKKEIFYPVYRNQSYGFPI